MLNLRQLDTTADFEAEFAGCDTWSANGCLDRRARGSDPGRHAAAATRQCSVRRFDVCRPRAWPRWN
jgi:hypothetical protein